MSFLRRPWVIHCFCSALPSALNPFFKFAGSGLCARLMSPLPRIMFWIRSAIHTSQVRHVWVIHCLAHRSLLSVLCFLCPVFSIMPSPFVRPPSVFVFAISMSSFTLGFLRTMVSYVFLLLRPAWHSCHFFSSRIFKTSHDRRSPGGLHGCGLPGDTARQCPHHVAEWKHCREAQPCDDCLMWRIYVGGAAGRQSPAATWA